jgi:hypothetical protein
MPTLTIIRNEAETRYELIDPVLREKTLQALLRDDQLTAPGQ